MLCLGLGSHAIPYIAHMVNVATRYIHLVTLSITLRRTLVKIGGSLRLTVPPEVADLLKANEGDMIEFATKNGDVIIRKAKG
jgi:hypothetical protein